MAEIKPIHLVFNDPSAISQATSPSKPTLAMQFAPLSKKILSAYPPAGVVESVNVATEFLEAIVLLDGVYGEDGHLPVEDASSAADEAIRVIADLQTQLTRLSLDDEMPVLDAIAIGVGLWCMRHQLVIVSPAPIVNALARRANQATSKQETAATYALMQGFIEALSAQLQGDLERSNPERPWRILNVNFAITAIRTGDTAMIRFAFDRFNAALPDECAGFYAEAYSLACQPGFPAETRSLIEVEQRRFSRTH